uniref:Uncharacterized protein n=1 Tax=Glossina pallidipes TaxID=7398 RepID=A0A1A9ZUR8_GLOPL
MRKLYFIVTEEKPHNEFLNCFSDCFFGLLSTKPTKEAVIPFSYCRSYSDTYVERFLDNDFGGWKGTENESKSIHVADYPNAILNIRYPRLAEWPKGIPDWPDNTENLGKHYRKPRTAPIK